MKIKLARTLGYCLGVRRAMDAAFKHLSQRGAKVYSHGELIHNPPALELLATKGLKIWRGETEGTVIIRAHGLPPDELNRLKALEPQGLSICDATCPRVRRVQKLVAKEAAEGSLVVIWGKKNHPEVIGLAGHAAPLGFVVAGPDELGPLPDAERVLLVSQTTQDLSRWPRMVEAVKARWPLARIENTICEATETRQRDVERLAAEVDGLVVVGGKTSGNTARLADIGRRLGKRTILAESTRDLSPDQLAGLETIGVAAGASTSTWQTAQILQALEAMARTKPRGGGGHSPAGKKFDAPFTLGGPGGFWLRLLRVMVLSGLFASLGLASLAGAARALMAVRPDPLIYSLFFYQIIALHLFRDFFQNRGASQQQAMRFNDPDRTAFFGKYKKQLGVFMAASAVAALAAALLSGPPGLMVLGLSWLGALIYLFLPRPQGRPSLLRALAGPLLLGCGWGFLMVSMILLDEAALIPLKAHYLGPAIFTGGAVFGPVFFLAVMSDVLAAHGDRIFGRPTLSTVFGEKTAKRILEVFTAAWAVWLAAGSLMGLLPDLAALMIAAGPLYSFLLLRLLFPAPFEGESSSGALPFWASGYRFEAAMYGQLILVGLMVLAWNA